MVNVITRGDGVEFAGCEICGNLTPVRVALDGELECSYCDTLYQESVAGTPYTYNN